MTWATHPFYNQTRWKRVRVEVKIRDGFRCTVCGATGVLLDVDHIEPWTRRPDLAFELTNLVTLCRRCHNRKTHGKPKRRRTSRAW